MKCIHDGCPNPAATKVRDPRCWTHIKRAYRRRKGKTSVRDDDPIQERRRRSGYERVVAAAIDLSKADSMTDDSFWRAIWRIKAALSHVRRAEPPKQGKPRGEAVHAPLNNSRRTDRSGSGSESSGVARGAADAQAQAPSDREPGGRGASGGGSAEGQ